MDLYVKNCEEWHEWLRNGENEYLTVQAVSTDALVADAMHIWKISVLHSLTIKKVNRFFNSVINR
jgi:hypothetical protein